MSKIKDLIQTIVELYESGMEPDVIAVTLEVKVKLVTDVLQDYCETYPKGLPSLPEPV